MTEFDTSISHTRTWSHEKAEISVFEKDDERYGFDVHAHGLTARDLVDAGEWIKAMGEDLVAQGISSVSAFNGVQTPV